MLVDHGEVQYPGLFGRIFGKRAKVIRDADLAVAITNLPPEARILNTDSNNYWVVYELPNGIQQIRFRAVAAWFTNEPSILPNRTNITSATVCSDGRIIVLEGMHRTRAVARDRVVLKPYLGGVEKVPGWLDFFFDANALQETPSGRAMAQMLGGDLDDRLVSAR